MSNPDCTLCHIESEEHEPGIWYCPGCGTVTDSARETASSGRVLDDPDDLDERFVKIIGVVHLESEGRRYVIDAPYEARGSIKKTDIVKTGRKWCSELNHWIVEPRGLDAVKEQLRDDSWEVIDLTHTS